MTWTGPAPPVTTWVIPAQSFLSVLGTENGFAILQESGSYILLENSALADTIWVPKPAPAGTWVKE